MKDEIQKRYAETISYYRKLRGMSQDELAFKAGIDRSYLSGIENGRRSFSINVLEMLSEALDVSVMLLTGGVVKEDPDGYDSQNNRSS
ncbi:MAG: helix-turn-helix transcriptional regulator [bacterium]